MKILVMTVGTGRNRDDIASAIAFSISKMRPDRVLLFTSMKTQEETYPLILEWLDDELKACCTSETFSNEDDVQFLFTEYVERMRKELQNCTEDEKKPTLWVDFTSGTKAMTAAIFAAGIALDAKTVCYVVGKRDETGRVIESDNVMEIEPLHILAERDISEARELFNQQDYAAAAHSVQRVKKLFDKGTHLGNLGNIIFALGQAYAEWNCFKWNQAAKLLRDNKKVFLREQSLVDPDFIEQQAAFCDRLDQGDFDVARLVDLYANACRCVKRKLYDDAMARLYRAVEYLVQIRLRLEFKIDTSNFKWKRFRSQLCKGTQDRFMRIPPPVQIGGLRDGIALLAELKDPIGQKLVEDYWTNWSPGADFRECNPGFLQRYLKSRNDSFLAHGTKPIEKSVVEQLLATYGNYLKDLLGDEFDDLVRLATFLRIE